MKIRNRRMLTSGLTAVSLAAVVGGVAAAQSTPTPPAVSRIADAPADEANEGPEGDEADEQEPALNGSIQVAEDESGSEADEAAQLAQMDGLISEQDAIAAATADGGTAETVELGNENGTVVWEVEVTATDGIVEEVKVDAGNGEILAREADDENEADESEADEANEGPEQDEVNEGPEGQENTNG